MKNFIIKLSILLAIFLAFAYYVFRNLADIKLTFHTTLSSMTSVMSWALLVGIGSYVFIVINYRRIFRLFGIEKEFWEMARLDLSALATAVVIPSFGMAGALVFVEDAVQKKYSRSSAFAAAMLYMLCDYSAISVLLMIALIYLFLAKSLGLHIIIPVLMFLVVNGFFYFMLFSASRSKGAARKILIKIIRPFNKIILKIFKEKYDAEVFIGKLLNELEITSKAVKKDPGILMTSIFLSLILHVARLFALYLLFVAIGFKIAAATLLIGYIIGMVLVAVAPTPNGVGFVEGGMVLMYANMGVPTSIAGTAVVIYRGFQFWLPFLVGLFFVQGKQLKKLKEDVVALNEEQS